MTTKHTPGPWTTTGPNIRADNDALVATVQDHWHDHKTPQGEKEANAQLMSAAPELLAACKEAVGQLECNCCSGCEGTCSWAIVHNAIAKAEGTPS